MYFPDTHTHTPFAKTKLNRSIVLEKNHTFDLISRFVGICTREKISNCGVIITCMDICLPNSYLQWPKLERIQMSIMIHLFNGPLYSH